MRIVKRNDLFDLSDLFDVPVLRNLLRTDVKEEDDKYLMDIEIPGFSREDINISYDEGYLIIEGKKQVETNEDVKYLRRERTNNDVKRSYYFGEVNYEGISASFKDGILSIVVPKKEPTVRKINIE